MNILREKLRCTPMGARLYKGSKSSSTNSADTTIHSTVDDARVTAAKTDIANLVQALKMYKLDNQRFPSAEQGLQALVSKPTTGTVPANWRPYVEKLPNDPWGRPYVYMVPGVKGEVDVLSFGADGKSGGTGNDADIGSWQ